MVKASVSGILKIESTFNLENDKLKILGSNPRLVACFCSFASLSSSTWYMSYCKVSAMLKTRASNLHRLFFTTNGIV